MRPRATSIVVLRRLLHRLGFDLVRSLGADDLLKRRLQLMVTRHIEVVFDVGAHSGQYAQTLRALGFRGHVISFEPLPAPFSLLQQAAARDPLWEPVNAALGDRDGEVTMHVSGNSQSSSVLEMLPTHESAAPESAYVGTCQVRMTTLANAIGTYGAPGQPLFVKVDAQGYEEQVLDSAGDALQKVEGVQLELSLVPLYKGQALLEDMIMKMRERGFVLTSLEPGFHDPRTGQLLQTDGIFFRAPASGGLAQ
ncbi:MAG TPA: FkbM family methyltransferase [Chloroflexota bacterium]|nr:FkbM family methyltransferase [Chloroflexota bacterium]